MNPFATFILAAFLSPITSILGAAGEAKGETPAFLVFAQIPLEAIAKLSEDAGRFLPPARNIPGSRIGSIDLSKGAVTFRVLTPEFASACSPVASFDGKRVVFSGKITFSEPWNIWEMDVDGSNKRRIVQTPWDRLTPVYLSSIYTLDNLQRRDQIVFSASPSGALNEYGSGPAWSLYTCELSGQNLHRITFNLSADLDRQFCLTGESCSAVGNGSAADIIPRASFRFRRSIQMGQTFSPSMATMGRPS